MTGPLDGIKVVECSIWILGPYAGAMLADMGAEVIKVEETVGGDPSRAVKTYTLVPAEQVAQVNRSFLYECFNRNKRSIAVNLRQEEGREVVYKLVKKLGVDCSIVTEMYHILFRGQDIQQSIEKIMSKECLHEHHLFK